MKLRDVSFQHRISSPQLTKPWSSKPGPGIHNISLTLERGTIVGLIGPNGSGKTTLMRVIAGLYSENSGKINLKSRQRRKSVGFMPEQVRWEGKATVEKALTEISLMHMIHPVNLTRLLEVVGLSERTNSPLDNLSQGMRQRLSLACALIGDPEILVLDEPMNGLDPLAQKSFCKLLKKLADKGTCVLISSHQMNSLLDLVDKFILLHKGQLLIEGTLSELGKKLKLETEIEVSGIGKAPRGMTQDGEEWYGVIKDEPQNIIEEMRGKGLCYIQKKPVDLVDLISAATGLNIDETGMNLTQPNMVPLRKVGEEE